MHERRGAGNERAAGEEAHIEPAIGRPGESGRNRIEFLAIVSLGVLLLSWQTGDQGNQTDIARGRVDLEHIIAASIGRIEHAIGAHDDRIGIAVDGVLGIGMMIAFERFQIGDHLGLASREIGRPDRRATFHWIDRWRVRSGAPSHDIERGAGNDHIGRADDLGAEAERRESAGGRAERAVAIDRGNRPRIAPHRSGFGGGWGASPWSGVDRGVATGAGQRHIDHAILADGEMTRVGKPAGIDGASSRERGGRCFGGGRCVGNRGRILRPCIAHRPSEQTANQQRAGGSQPKTVSNTGHVFLLLSVRNMPMTKRRCTAWGRSIGEERNCGLDRALLPG